MSGGAYMGKKGAFAERELAALLADLTGYPVERRLKEGRIDDIGDLDGLPGCTAQVKWWINIQSAVASGLPAMLRQQEIAETPYGVLFIRRSMRVRSDERWLAVQPLRSFTTMYLDAIGNATPMVIEAAASGE
jgi:hypothetical protein